MAILRQSAVQTLRMAFFGKARLKMAPSPACSLVRNPVEEFHADDAWATPAVCLVAQGGELADTRAAAAVLTPLLLLAQGLA